MNSSVVVWSYFRRNVWFAFEPAVSNFIEVTTNASKSNQQHRQHCYRSHVHDIGSLSSKFAFYEVDLEQCILRKTLEGTETPIQRRVCPAKSLCSQNAVWEFEGDYPSQPWITFDMDTAQMLDDAKGKRKKKIDLSQTTSLPYVIDLGKLTQTNVQTQRSRKIRRTTLPEAYVTDTPGAMGGVSSTGKRKRPSRAAKKAGNAPDHKSPSPVGAGGQTQSRSESLPRQSHLAIKDLGCSSSNDSDPLSQFTKSVEVVRGEDDDEECAICFDKLSEECSYGEGRADGGDVVMLLQCQHSFHKLCLLEMYKITQKDGFLQCPKCKCVHGEKVGNCPAGRMQWNVRKDMPLPGHEDFSTIVVSYHIPAGVQVRGHPNPGQPFAARGFPRVGYLPDSEKGRKVLKLLMEAFRRRLMFTIGQSSTTGESNTVIWNDIHHKTEALSNHHGHGYPDPNYLDNVLMELCAQGVTEDCLGD